MSRNLIKVRDVHPYDAQGLKSIVMLPQMNNAPQSIITIITRDGAILETGYNATGELGDGTLTAKTPPFWVNPRIPLIVNPTGINKMTIGGNVLVIPIAGFQVAIRASNGAAWSWGANTRAQLGDGSITSKSYPVAVQGVNSFTQVAAGSSWAYAIRGSDGTMWSWGGNSIGILADGSVANKSSPVSVLGGNSYVYISAGSGHTAAIRGVDGILFCWGMGTIGQLGDGTIVTKSSPVSVQGGNSFVQVDCGTSHTAAIRGSDGIAFVWGFNQSGEIGDNTTANKSSPVSVAGGLSFKKVATGSYWTVGIAGDNTLWGWGKNAANIGSYVAPSLFQQPGQVSWPVSVIADKTFTLISGGSYFVTALMADGTAWSWGNNNGVAVANSHLGVLGDNTTANKSTPASVVGGYSFIAIAQGCTRSHNIAIRGSDGTAWGWGRGQNYQLGNGGFVDKSSPVSVLGGNSFVRVTANGPNTFAIRGLDGTMWGWGANGSGQLGKGDTANNGSSPQSVLGAISFVEVAAGNVGATGIRGSDGTAWAWGTNPNGEVGDNSITTRTSPASVVGANSYIKIARGTIHVMAIRGSDGTLWGWGYNGFGQLGDGTVTGRSSPVSVLGGHSFVDVRCHSDATIARKADGSLWGWGRALVSATPNLTGGWLAGQAANALPVGNFTSPTSVVGGHSFAEFTCGGIGFTFALKTNSTWFWGGSDLYPYLWGNNVVGADRVSSPVSVMGGRSFIDVVATTSWVLAVEKNTGIVYRLGIDPFLGLPSNTNYYFPWSPNVSGATGQVPRRYSR
jgi:alpha-tubulin suppressor-like RCC1 family protein